MIVRALLFAALAVSPASADEVPSGQSVSLHEVLVDERGGTTWLRFRFLAPQIGADAGKIGFDVAGQDMLHLCDTLALTYIDDFELPGDRIVISLMDRVTDFAVADPDATQYFEAFRPVDGSCMWDEF